MRLALLPRSLLLRDIGVVGGLSAAAFGGQRVFGVDSGLASFALASVVSATQRSGVWQLHPVLEHASWTVVLQTSLILGVWASRSRTSVGASSPRKAAVKKSAPMIVAFALGCIGTMLGSFCGVKCAAQFASTSSSSVWPIAASCLAASYTGGTANFFEVANVLGALQGPVARALSLIAGIDILVMVIYFGVLLSLRSWVVKGKGKPRSFLSFLYTDGGISAQNNLVAVSATSVQSHVGVALVVAVAGLLAMTAAQVQRLLPRVPGLSVMASVLSAVFLASKSPVLGLASPATLAASCELAMGFFYACIGAGCRVQDVFSVGPSIMLLMFITLTVHITTLLLGSWAWNGACRDSSIKIDVDTAIIASNACVGGASTAASMAAGLKNSDPDLPWLGSLAGVLGYVVGTPLGLALAASLKVPLPP